MTADVAVVVAALAAAAAVGSAVFAFAQARAASAQADAAREQVALAREALDDAREAAQGRIDARRLLVEVMTVGMLLLEDLRAASKRGNPSGETARLYKLYRAWEDRANQAVSLADDAQLARYHAPLGDAGVTTERALAERLRRLQEIQDRI